MVSCRGPAPPRFPDARAGGLRYAPGTDAAKNAPGTDAAKNAPGTDAEMKPSELKVKKDAEKDVVFHYSREERLAMASAPKGPKSVSGGFFRGFFHRGRLPSLLPLLIVALVVVLVFKFAVPRSSSRAILSGYEAVLRASLYADALFVSVTFTPAAGARKTIPAGTDSSTAGGSPTASVSLELPDTGERLLLSEALGDGPSTIRGKMKYIGKERKLTARVRVGEKAASLSLGLRKP